MPNTGHTTLCPFFLSESGKTVTCEDASRMFRSLRKKRLWMGDYCDDQWERCPYAYSLLKLYDQIEKDGEEGEILKEQHTYDAIEAEYRKLRVQYGRLEKRLYARDEEIKDLRRKNHALGDQYEKIRTAYDKEKKNAKSLSDALFHGLPVYEARFCYLMEMFSDGMFNETDFQDWSKGKEFRLEVAGKDEDGNVTLWKSNVREVKEDGKRILADDKEKE